MNSVRATPLHEVNEFLRVAHEYVEGETLADCLVSKLPVDLVQVSKLEYAASFWFIVLI